MTESTTIGVGNVLFRVRSFTPIPVLALLAFLLWRSRGVTGPGGAELDLALDVLGVLVATGGQALRFYTLGLVPEGTSGQGSALEASRLNTRGPYAHVRNPLYLGNLGICLGLMLLAHDGWVYGVGLSFFFGEYFFIIRAEENFLRGRFGPEFDEFTRKVRRWVPRLSAAYPGQLRERFDLARALKKEHNPFAAWASGALVLLAWERLARGGLSAKAVALFLSLEAIVLVAFATIKAYKRGWLRPGGARTGSTEGKQAGS